MRCRAADCGAEILMARTVNGADMPVDPDPRPDGNLRLLREDGVLHVYVLTGAELAIARDAEEPLHVSHFTTCTAPRRFRRYR